MRFLFASLFISITLLNYAQEIPQNPNLTDENGLRQGKWTIWYDHEWGVTNEEKRIAYYRLIEYRDNLPIDTVRDFYLSGVLQMVGVLLADRPEEIYHGLIQWYDNNGNLETSRRFENGNLLTQVDGQTIVFDYQKAVLASNEYIKGNYANTIELLNQVINDARFGLDYHGYISLGLILANSYRKVGLMEKAKLEYEKLHDDLINQIGRNNELYANFLKSYALYFREVGQLKKSQDQLIESLSIQENLNLKESKLFSTTLHNLATVYLDRSELELAEMYYMKAMKIKHEIYEESNHSYLSTLLGLTNLYLERGYTDKAKELLIKVVNNSSNTEHPDYALILNSLGEIYKREGNLTKAENTYLISKSIFEDKTGKSNRFYPMICNNLGDVYREQGNIEMAEIYFLEAISTAENLNYADSNYPNYLSNLALLYENTRNSSESEKLLNKSRAYIQKSKGTFHLDYVAPSSNLGYLAFRQGNFSKAETLFKECLEILDSTNVQEHPAHSTILVNLAYTYENIGDIESVRKLFLKSNSILIRQLKRYFHFLSQNERVDFLKTFDYNFEAFQSIVINYRHYDFSLISENYRLLLITKSLLFNDFQRIKNLIYQSRDPLLISVFKKWKSERSYLANLYQSNSTNLISNEIKIRNLETKIDSLEKQLSARSIEFAEATDTVSYSWEDVKANLQTNEAAIEMVRFNYHDKKWTDSIIYMAMIVKATTEDHPELVVLPNGNELETKYLADYKQSIHQAADSVGRGGAIVVAGKAVSPYETFWGAISEHLEGVEKVYLSADGVYYNINLNALQNPETGKYLIHEIDLETVSSTKELVMPKKDIDYSNDACLVGYPAYQASSTAEDFDYQWQVAQNFEKQRNGRFIDGEYISELPGTKEEIINLEGIIGANGLTTYAYLDTAATEDKIKSLKDPRILHIATHGYFLEDVQLDKESKTLMMGVDQQKAFENPLLRSGLLLTGAQQAIKEGGSGILTAYEALNLNLDKTELVVLSACETGLGEVKNGEGVYGLQRAFQTAGAQSVLMSLWNVSDDATQELMTLFYTNWLEKGMDKRTAFKAAQLTLRAKHPEPYYWASFVMVGE